MKDVMIDLETMGNGPSAAIIAIGAVSFDIKEQKLGAEFYCKISLESSVKAGGVMDASTVLWWLQQSEEARAEFKEKGAQIHDALHDFQLWMDSLHIDIKERKVWGNGATFDNVILRSAYNNCSMKTPWEYFGDRCYRTVKNMYPHIKMERTGTHHNALDDAKSQAVHLMAMLNGV